MDTTKKDTKYPKIPSKGHFGYFVSSDVLFVLVGFCYVLGGCHTKFSYEASGEVGGVGKSHFIHHFRNRQVFSGQQHGCLFHTNMSDIFYGSEAGQLF